MSGRLAAGVAASLAALAVFAPVIADGGDRGAHPAGGVGAATVTGGAIRHRLYLPGISVGEGTPAPAEDPPPDERFVGLQQALADSIAAYDVDGLYGIAVTDLQTGQRIGVNGDRQQRAGCLVNLFVIIATLREVQAGTIPLEAVDGLIRQTIWASDATTARELYEIIGGGDVVAGVGEVERLLHETLKLDAMVIDHPPAYPEWSLGISGDNWATAEAMNAALAALYHGELLNPDWTHYLLEAMRSVKPGLNYLTANLPEDAVVSHKNGFFWEEDGYIDNDTAIVRFESGGQWFAYAITFVSEQVNEEYADIWLGRDLVQMTWDYFRQVYG